MFLETNLLQKFLTTETQRRRGHRVISRFFLCVFVTPWCIFSAGIIQGQGFGGIKGFMTDAENGEKLSYANVYLQDTDLGASTNEKGYYFISKIPAGTYQIVFSYIGYETIKKEVNIKPNEFITVNTELKPTIIQVKEVKVTGERTRFEKSVEMSRIAFTPREIKAVPSFIESDLIKTMQLMPGITTMHDLSNKLYVRGGSPDENLVLLDGITIYNPSTHLFGLFSTFNPDAVSSAEAYLGGFPAMYGDRLSSVLNVTTKEGNSKRYAGTGSIGLITSKFLIEGPIPKGSFLFSGRRTYFDALVWAYKTITKKDMGLPYYFYDGVGKINFNPSTDNRFTLSLFGGSDVIIFEETDPKIKINLRWGNQGSSLRWRRVFTPKLYGELLGVWSNFFTSFVIEETDKTELKEDIRSFSKKADFTYLATPHHTLNFGLFVENFRVLHQWETPVTKIGKPTQTTNLLGLYFQDKWEILPTLYLQPGLRVIYNNLHSSFYFDPRIGLKYRFHPNSALNFAMGKYSQFLTTLNNQESYFSIFDFWQMVEANRKVPNSLHFVSGLEQWYGEDTKFTIEGYYKRYDNLLIPKEDDIFFSNPTESLDVADGYATGLDIFLKKSINNLFGWTSYSLGLTQRRLKGKNEKYFPRYDRRHNLNIVFGWTIPKRVPVFKNASLNLRWYFGTGLPYAGDIARYQHYNYDFSTDLIQSWNTWHTIKGGRDAYRLPASHRLDVHYEKPITLFGLKGEWYFDLINLYGQKNVLFYNWEYYDNRTGEVLNPPKKVGFSILPFPIPSLGINLRF